MKPLNFPADFIRALSELDQAEAVDKINALLEQRARSLELSEAQVGVVRARVARIASEGHDFDLHWMQRQLTQHVRLSLLTRRRTCT